MAQYSVVQQQAPAPFGPPAQPGVTSAAPKKVAIFITHGMGQQIPFETLDQIAEGLRKRDIAAGNPNRNPVSKAVKSDDQWFNRIELQLKSGAEAVEAHVYEAYWAPVTEGRITIRNVIGFLASAGRNGLRNAKRGRFERWLFGEFTEYPIPIRTLFHLIVTLAAIGALVVMNSSIAVVGAALSFLGNRPAWLTPGLLADLTTSFNVVVASMAFTGAALFVSVKLHSNNVRPKVRIAWSTLTALLFGKTIFAVILAGVALPLLFYGHVRGGVSETHRFMHEVFSSDAISRFDAAFMLAAWIVGLAVLGYILLRWLWALIAGVARDLADPGGRVATVTVVIVFALLAIAVALLVAGFIKLFYATAAIPAGATLGSGISWALLVAASAFVRSVLVQFVGDVAAYVQSYKLDAFADLRREIKERSFKVAQGIFGMRDASGNPAYSGIVVVGHSLGSVIAYDVLNQLIREDEEAGRKLDVVKRTPLFITFGSPLDKTAFIFALQGSNTTEARESVAATVQPMLQSYATRPAKWVNIYSGWDIISGSLGFYDLEKNKKTNPQAVENVRDPEATTLLVAHTEYWNNPLVLRTIYNAL